MQNEDTFKSGYCICIVSTKYTTEKINGFESIKGAKNFLKNEFLQLFEDEYTIDYNKLKDFCSNDKTCCYFIKSNFGFIHIRKSVWKINEHKTNEYNG